MKKLKEEIQFNCSADELWSILSDVGRCDWVPTIEKITLGKTKSYHDLKSLKEPLRSHGGLSEQKVPFIVNKPINLSSVKDLKNYDAFFYACEASFN